MQSYTFDRSHAFIATNLSHYRLSGALGHCLGRWTESFKSLGPEAKSEFDTEDKDRGP